MVDAETATGQILVRLVLFPVAGAGAQLAVGMLSMRTRYDIADISRTAFPAYVHIHRAVYGRQMLAQAESLTLELLLLLAITAGDVLSHRFAQTQRWWEERAPRCCRGGAEMLHRVPAFVHMTRNVVFFAADFAVIAALPVMTTAGWPARGCFNYGYDVSGQPGLRLWTSAVVQLAAKAATHVFACWLAQRRGEHSFAADVVCLAAHPRLVALYGVTLTSTLALFFLEAQFFNLFNGECPDTVAGVCPCLRLVNEWTGGAGDLEGTGGTKTGDMCCEDYCHLGNVTLRLPF